MNTGRTAFYQRVYQDIATLSGDVADCGVGKGKSLKDLAALAAPDRRTIWAFESWGVFPPLIEQEQTPATLLMQYTVVGDKRIVLERLNGLSSHVRFVDGYFERTMPRWNGALALVNIDADIFNSYWTALTCLWPKVVAGGIVIFDEYHEAKYPGAKKASDKFLATVPHELHEDIRWWAAKR